MRRLVPLALLAALAAPGAASADEPVNWLLATLAADAGARQVELLLEVDVQRDGPPGAAFSATDVPDADGGRERRTFAGPSPGFSVDVAHRDGDAQVRLSAVEGAPYAYTFALSMSIVVRGATQDHTYRVVFGAAPARFTDVRVEARVDDRPHAVEVEKGNGAAILDWVESEGRHLVVSDHAMGDGAWRVETARGVVGGLLEGCGGTRCEASWRAPDGRTDGFTSTWPCTSACWAGNGAFAGPAGAWEFAGSGYRARAHGIYAPVGEAWTHFVE